MACDTTSNLNVTALDQFSNAVAHSTQVFANLKPVKGKRAKTDAQAHR